MKDKIGIVEKENVENEGQIFVDKFGDGEARGLLTRSNSFEATKDRTKQEAGLKHARKLAKQRSKKLLPSDEIFGVPTPLKNGSTPTYKEVGSAYILRQHELQIQSGKNINPPHRQVVLSLAAEITAS